MNRRAFISFLAAAATIPAGRVFAASIEDDIIAQLKKQGFTDITSETTWLGRLRILAWRNDGSREIVINPRTGEILRDQFTGLDGEVGSQPILDDVAEGSGKGGSGKGGSDDGSSGSTSGSDDGNSGGSSGGSSGSGSGSSGGSDDNSGSGSGSGSGGGSGSGSGSGGSSGGGSGSNSEHDGNDDDKGDDN